MATATLRNDFHHTEITVKVPASGILSQGQYSRARKALCGIDGCTCGALRGKQEVQVEEVQTDSHKGTVSWKIN